MLKKVIALTIASLSLLSGFCAGGKNAVALMERPVGVKTVKDISGFYGDKIRLNREVYLKNFPIDKYVDFVVARDFRDWDWTRAEQHGKWIESACLSAAQSGDNELNAKFRSVIDRIIDSQEESGYVGATALDFRSDERPIRGMDPYELYFVFHAFMTAYEETGDVKSLNAAEKLADYFLNHFGSGKLEFWPSALRAPENKHKEIAGTSEFAGHSVHYSWEGTLLCDPITRLYELTGKKKYLDWSKWVVSNIDKWSGWDAFSRLDSVADGNIGVDALQPYVHSHTFHMNFMGFLRMYKVTGDKSLLRKVMGAWDDIFNRQMYITGGVSVAEHYEKGYVKPFSGNIVETCATMSWMQLTQQLLELTGDTKYADAIERLMINHVFAAQDSETGVCRYHTAPNGMKPEGFFHGPDCCTASGHRIISLLPTFLYAENNKDFYINQYMPSKYQGADFAFDVIGNYPESDKIEVRIDSDKSVKKCLNLRIPAWCSNPEVTVNGESIDGVEPGKYVAINRKFSKDDVIALHFPMEERWIRRENHNEYVKSYLPGGEIMYEERPAKDVPYAFMRGPVVYSVDMIWNKHICNDDLDIEKDLRIDTTHTPSITEKPYADLMGPVFTAKAQVKGRPADIILTPFGNNGQWYRPGEDRPHPHSDSFSYAVWMYGDSNTK